MIIVTPVASAHDRPGHAPADRELEVPGHFRATEMCVCARCVVTFSVWFDPLRWIHLVRLVFCGVDNKKEVRNGAKFPEQTGNERTASCEQQRENKNQKGGNLTHTQTWVM